MMRLIKRISSLSILILAGIFSSLPSQVFAQSCAAFTQDQQLFTLLVDFSEIQGNGRNFIPSSNTVALNDLIEAEEAIANAEGSLANPSAAIAYINKAATDVSAIIKLVNNSTITQIFTKVESDLTTLARTLQQSAYIQTTTYDLTVAIGLVDQVSALESQAGNGSTAIQGELHSEIEGAKSLFDQFNESSDKSAIASLNTVLTQIAPLLTQLDGSEYKLMNEVNVRVNAAIANIQADMKNNPN